MFSQPSKGLPWTWGSVGSCPPSLSWSAGPRHRAVASVSGQTWGWPGPMEPHYPVWGLVEIPWALTSSRLLPPTPPQSRFFRSPAVVWTRVHHRTPPSPHSVLVHLVCRPLRTVTSTSPDPSEAPLPAPPLFSQQHPPWSEDTFFCSCLLFISPKHKHSSKTGASFKVRPGAGHKAGSQRRDHKPLCTWGPGVHRLRQHVTKVRRQDPTEE